MEENKDLAAFSYVWIMSVFVYISKRQSPFIAFHARQGMVLFLLSIMAWFVPGLWRFLELLVLGGAILGFLAAAQGQWKEVPIIGPLARGTLRFSGSEKFIGQLSRFVHSIAGVVEKFLKKKKPPSPIPPPSFPSSPA